MYLTVKCGTPVWQTDTQTDGQNYDSYSDRVTHGPTVYTRIFITQPWMAWAMGMFSGMRTCLLYTSDAADE